MVGGITYDWEEGGGRRRGQGGEGGRE